jgi:hypothetical protein
VASPGLLEAVFSLQLFPDVLSNLQPSSIELLLSGDARNLNWDGGEVYALVAEKHQAA